ncbi:T9SS type A sorting domain-containing protein [Adhaeribacter pallidiroseus]|nr:T9SS type A sorting domain-containing protein [Adhaeribacter pallidiroseus]
MSVAQGIANNGGKIVVGTGAYLTIAGNNANLTNTTAAGTNGSIDNNGAITLAGTLTNNAGNNVFINPNGIGDVVFTGTTGQAVAGSALTVFERFIVNNAAGLTLQQNTVTNALSLTQGPLLLNGRSLTITNNNPAAVSRTAGYVVSEQTNNSGKVIWNMGSTTGAHIFPFGTVAGSYIPFTFNLTAGTIGNVTVATYPSNAANQPYPVTPNAVTNVNGWDGKDNSANTVDRFWQIDKDGISGTATLTFTATTAEVGAVTLLRAQRWNSARQLWDIPLPGQSNTANTAMVPGVTNFSPWTLSGNNSPLPAELVHFSAAVNQSWVDLHWQTAAETAGSIFAIERTRDLVHYESVAAVKGSGNIQPANLYKVQDKKPHGGLSYYRLKQTKANQKSTYSEVVAVNVAEKTVFAVQVYPNPTEEILNISISGTNNQEYLVVLTDLVGQRYYMGKVITGKAGQTLQLTKTQHFPPGVFLLSVTGNGHFFSKKVVVK